MFLSVCRSVALWRLVFVCIYFVYIPHISLINSWFLWLPLSVHIWSHPPNQPLHEMFGLYVFLSSVPLSVSVSFPTFLVGGLFVSLFVWLMVYYFAPSRSTECYFGPSLPGVKGERSSCINMQRFQSTASENHVVQERKANWKRRKPTEDWQISTWGSRRLSLQFLNIFNKQFIQTSFTCFKRFVFVLALRPTCHS